MGLGRGHVQEALDPSRPGADVAVHGCGRGWFWPGAGVDVAGRDVAREVWRGRCGEGGVAREVWGKWLVFVVSLDRVSCRRMCEGCHPDAGAGLRMKGCEGVERWREGGRKERWAGGLCWEWGDAVSCLDGRSDNFTDNCGLVVVSCACSVQRAACGVRRAACGVRRAARPSGRLGC